MKLEIKNTTDLKLTTTVSINRTTYALLSNSDLLDTICCDLKCKTHPNSDPTFELNKTIYSKEGRFDTTEIMDNVNSMHTLVDILNRLNTAIVNLKGLAADERGNKTIQEIQSR